MCKTLKFIFIYGPSICSLVPAVASLIGAPIGIMSSALGLIFCSITAEIKIISISKKYKQTTKKKGKYMIK